MKWLKSLLNFFRKTEQPASTDKPPVELSYSRVQAYLRCPWLYHLVYEEGWRSGPTGGMALGQSLHRALEAYLSKRNEAERSWERLAEIYDQVWVNEGFASPQETLDAYDSGRKMLERFFETDQSRTTEVVETESEFQEKLSPRLNFRGTVDRLDRHPDGTYEVIEYKTQGNHWTESRVENDLQMTFYAMGMRAKLGKVPIKLRFHFLSTGDSIVAHRSEEQIQAAGKTLRDVGEKIESRDFKPNPNHCSRCEFGTRCQYYKKPMEKVS